VPTSEMGAIVVAMKMLSRRRQLQEHGLHIMAEARKDILPIVIIPELKCEL
jgi:hypothetical protein